MTAVARVRVAPRRDPEIARLLDWADGIAAEPLYTHAEPVSMRDWGMWLAGHHAGHTDGYQQGRHALMDENDAAEQRAWTTWVTVTGQARIGRELPSRDDPRFRAWRARR